MRVKKKEVVVVIALLVLALVPRMADLGVFLTADEKNWIGRSYEFVRAFKDWRFNDMLQTTHPGVTTLWLSGAAITAKILISHIPFSFQNLFFFVRVAQFPIALVNSLTVPAIYLLLRQIFPKRSGLAVLAGAIIALDPFLIGYSRVVHVDALMAGFLFLAALATILYVQKSYARNWLIASACLSGLAVLTKAPAVFIVPFYILVVLVQEKRKFFGWAAFRERGRDFVLWLLIIGLMFVLLWPAMLWVENPEGNLLVLKRDLVIATSTPHHMSEGYTVNPIFYVYTLLTRTTPVTLGLALLVVIIFASRIPPSLKLRRASLSPLFSASAVRSAVYLLIAYIFFFVVMMTLGAKKGDRYILPVFLAIDVLAAVGVFYASRIISNFPSLRPARAGFRRARQFSNTVLGTLVVLYLGFTVYSYHPYAIAYSNPFFPDNLSQELGWGEGLEQVGAWLNVNDPDAVVASWYPEELGAYTTAGVAHINAHEQPRVHYVVLYHNMFGRAPDHYANDFIDEYYKKLEPVFVARAHGKEYAWVYEKQTYERVIGELLPNVRAGQEIQTAEGAVRGVEVLVATYSGQATQGDMMVNLRTSLQGSVLHTWRVPVQELEDNRWLELNLPGPVKADSVFVEVSAMDTQKGNAPTVRYSSEYDYLPSQMLLSTSGRLLGANVKEGDLAVRLR
ncbi:MAG: glycosyltransferase family 39 protein [bacterium]